MKIIIAVHTLLMLTCFTITASATSISTSDTTTTPDFSLIDSNGKNISIHSLQGKVVFINFWATWCQPCVQEMPSINELKESFNGNDQVVFLTIDVDAELPKSKAYMDNKHFTLPVYAATTAIPRVFYYHSIPTTTILDKNGEIIWHVEGGKDYTSPEIRRILTEHIESK
ncbi:TlpA family protein disulfide reductase [Chitinophaga sancti]|nr:TlpA disulfide reductase family protein [Chitinophaga sancti]WQD63025.1 TlpA disulfide reductase family protein [Chitinophaga sancti]WQG91350.1 TlpA disulfide reductase family protein [Chitinophaga sancti]